MPVVVALPARVGFLVVAGAAGFALFSYLAGLRGVRSRPRRGPRARSAPRRPRRRSSGPPEQSMRVLVLTDTHIGPSRPGRRLPDAVYELLDDADAVLHAGDVTAPELLHELAGFAPVHAVLGNNDVDLRLPERLEVDLDGVRVAMVHDSGPSAGRAGRPPAVVPRRRRRRVRPLAPAVARGRPRRPAAPQPRVADRAPAGPDEDRRPRSTSRRARSGARARRPVTAGSRIHAVRGCLLGS